MPYIFVILALFWLEAVAWPAQPDGPSPDVIAPNLEGYEQQFPSMGTLMTFQAFSADKSQVDQAFKAAEKEVERLVNIMSDYDPESELSKINQLAGTGKWSPVSPELWEVLDASDRWNRLSEGTFDASLGALTRLWRKARRQKKIPTQMEIENALQSCGWKHVEFDRQHKSIRLLKPGMFLDLGAIAKGYIVDRAFDILRSCGLQCCMVNAGGNLRCGDPPPNRSGWRIEISSLQEGEPPLRRLYLKNAAISTSGDLWQFMLIDNKRRSHILDARTGWGIEGPVSVSVIAPTAQEADAASTSMCVLGRSRGLEVLSALDGFDALFLSRVDHEKSLEETPINYSVTDGFAQGIR